MSDLPNVRYYGIKTPEKSYQKSFIWWISIDRSAAWMYFFNYDHDKGQGTAHPFRGSLGEAIDAYEAIGYECVEVNIVEKETNEENKTSI